MEKQIILKKKKLLVGVVVSKKMEKTATVEVSVTKRDVYVGKVIRQKKKYQVHDPLDEAVVGNTVEFYEGKKVSKTKFMYLHKIVGKAAVHEKNVVAGDV